MHQCQHRITNIRMISICMQCAAYSQRLSKYCFAFSNSPVSWLSWPNASNVTPTSRWSLSPYNARHILKDSSKYCFAFPNSPFFWLSCPNAYNVGPTSGWSLSPCSARCILKHSSKYCFAFSNSPVFWLSCPNACNVAPTSGWSLSPCSARCILKHSSKYCFAFSKSPVWRLTWPNACKAAATPGWSLSPCSARSILKHSSKYCFAFSKSPVWRLTWPNAYNVTPTPGWSLSPCSARLILKASSKCCLASLKSPALILNCPSLWRIFARSGWFFCRCLARKTSSCSSNCCNSFKSSPPTTVSGSLDVSSSKWALVSVVMLAEKPGFGADGNFVGWVSGSESSSACVGSNMAAFLPCPDSTPMATCGFSNSSTFNVAAMMRPQANVHSAQASGFATLSAKSRICSKIWNGEPLVLSCWMTFGCQSYVVTRDDLSLFTSIISIDVFISLIFDKYVNTKSTPAGITTTPYMQHTEDWNPLVKLKILAYFSIYICVHIYNIYIYLLYSRYTYIYIFIFQLFVMLWCDMIYVFSAFEHIKTECSRQNTKVQWTNSHTKTRK